MPTVSIVGNRTAGDDWTWLWSSTDDLTAWDVSTLEITIRDGNTLGSTLLASSVDTPMTIVTTGSAPLDLPASVFNDGSSFISAYLAAGHTDDLDPLTISSVTFWMGIRAAVDGRMCTVLPPTPFLCYSRLAT